MSIIVDTAVARHIKDALIDAFPAARSAHLSEIVAALFGFRTAKAFKDALADAGSLKTAFHDAAAAGRALCLLECTEQQAAEIAAVARSAAIAARVRAGRERAERRKEADLRRAQEARAAPVGRYADINGKLVGFVVETRKGLFKPFVGRVVDQPDDHDAIIWVVGQQPAQESLEAAMAFFEPDRESFALILARPVPSGGMMGHWLNEMTHCQSRVFSGTAAVSER